MHTDRFASFAPTLLRVAMGLQFIAHAGLKLLVFTPAGTAQFFDKVGLPGWLAWPTILAEALGGAALVLGIGTRWVALGLAPILLGSIVWVHGSMGFFFNAPGGGWEFPALWLVALLALAALGDGAYALGRRRTRPHVTAAAE